MFVRKFEADTIEEALKDIKRELGPDAVILKTITNKGLKGAFKKKKIEITAAISEKNYVKKAQVDHVLNEEQKGQFYNGSASYIANMIDQHDQSQEKRAVLNNKPAASNKPNSGYGMAGLNKQVTTTKGFASQIKEGIKEGLDEFLSLGEKEDRHSARHFEENDFDFEEELEASRPAPTASVRAAQVQSARPATTHHSAPAYSAPVAEQGPSVVVSKATEEQVEKQKNKIEELEKKLFELSRNFERIHKKEPIGIYQLRTTLRSLDINETYIQQLIKKGMFELTDKDTENAEAVFEYALKDMMGNVYTGNPLYAEAATKGQPAVSVLLSEFSCGQTSMIQKIAARYPNSVIVKNSAHLKMNKKGESKAPFAEKIFGINVVQTSTIAEMVSECRKALESGKAVFIDYKCNESEINETKKFIDGLRRAFSRVEVLITLSAIHTELYNRKVISTYKKVSDGIVLSHLDACLNFGSLFNITQENRELPYKFFGTGEVCPDDLEPATAERLMAGIFRL